MRSQLGFFTPRCGSGELAHVGEPDLLWPGESQHHQKQTRSFPAQPTAKAAQHWLGALSSMFSPFLIFAIYLPCSFLEMMEARSRGHTSPLTTNGQSPSSGSQSPIVPPSSTSTGSSSPGTPQPPQPLSTSSAVSPEPPPSFSPVPAPEAQQLHAPLPATASPAPPAAAPPPKRSIIARLFGTSPASDPSPPQRGRCWGTVSRQGVTHGPFSGSLSGLRRAQASSVRPRRAALFLVGFGVSPCWAWMGQCPASWLVAVVCFRRKVLNVQGYQ